MPVKLDQITYKGDTSQCTDVNHKTDRGQWCICSFVLCTGASQCNENFLGEDTYYRLMHESVDYSANLTKDDCDCTEMKK